MTASSHPDEARELLAAAKRDQHALVILSRDAQAPVEIAPFLAQQAIEKAIKSVFAMHGVVYRRTHDLLLLATLSTEAGIILPVNHDLLARLGPMPWSFDTWGRWHPMRLLRKPWLPWMRAFRGLCGVWLQPLDRRCVRVF